MLGVYRDPRFSPNSVRKDEAIMNAVLDGLDGCHVSKVWEAELTGTEQADVVFSMARSERALELLDHMEQQGAAVLNSASGVRACVRSVLDRTMRDNNVPMPPAEGTQGWWLKRGDASAQSRDDVVYCEDDSQLEAAKRRFRERGVTDMVVSAHVAGDLVKFYGVRGTGFFRTYYPSDDGQSKFGDERKNGLAHHYIYNKVSLTAEAERLSALTGTPIYGGDCIVEPDGCFRIIDFNDWPSYSRCREEAAKAIIQLIRK